MPPEACLFSALHLQVDHPLFDYIPVKTDFGADFESWNLTLANQSVECGQMNP